MKSEIKYPKNGGVARLREHFQKIKENIKPSPELIEITRDKQVSEEKENSNDRKKVAAPKRRSGNLDL